MSIMIHRAVPWLSPIHSSVFCVQTSCISTISPLAFLTFLSAPR